MACGVFNAIAVGWTRGPNGSSPARRRKVLTLSQLTLPKDTAGSVTLRENDNGRISTRRFVDGAKFVLDGREIRYADFLKVVADLRADSKANDTTVANVYVDIATERVTRVAIRRPRR